VKNPVTPCSSPGEITRDDTNMPRATAYHRLIGWHAPAIRRALITGGLGCVTAIAALRALDWELSVVTGWDVGAVAYLASSWSLIGRADGVQTEHFATREDETRRITVALVLGASVASLIAVGFILGAAGRETGGQRLLFIVGALLTVVLSWTVVNTVFTLHYAHLHYSAPAGVDFGSLEADFRPDYRDFAYLAFTIGMTYQVSDPTMRDRRIRRTVLVHSILSYLFGVVIIAAGINLVAGLID
jgi:uncharacterized membrane protein